MGEDNNKKYIAIIRLGSAPPSRERVMEAAPKIRATLETLSEKDCQSVFTTPDGSTFAFFLKTAHDPRVIRNALTGNDPRFGETRSILLNEDSVLIVEVGDSFDGQGFSRAWTWLQHR